ncbi:MAG: hypothetical protein V2A70_07450 [Candidatus Omnitrophota bacterium]
MAKSRKTVQEDLLFEVAFFEGVLRHSPDFVEAMVALAEIYTLQGEHEKGLKLDQRLAGIRPDDPVILYNLACSLSLMQDVPGAFEIMKRAVACGYDDFRHLEKDQDLMNLLTDDGFQEYYRALKGTSA